MPKNKPSPMKDELKGKDLFKSKKAKKPKKRKGY